MNVRDIIRPTGPAGGSARRRRTLTTLLVLFGLLASLLLTQAFSSAAPPPRIAQAARVAPAAAPPGFLGNWAIVANGFRGTLSIRSIDAAGNVTGTMFSNPIFGFFDNTSDRLLITRQIGAPNANQIYTGYYFTGAPSGNPDDRFLTGYFEAFGGTGGTAARPLYGWYARKEFEAASKQRS